MSRESIEATAQVGKLFEVAGDLRQEAIAARIGVRQQRVSAWAVAAKNGEKVRVRRKTLEAVESFTAECVQLEDAGLLYRSLRQMLPTVQELAEHYAPDLAKPAIGREEIEATLRDPRALTVDDLRLIIETADGVLGARAAD